MEWTPWELAKLSDAEYTRKIDSLTQMDLDDVDEFRENVKARYILHLGAMCDPNFHPKVIRDATRAVVSLPPDFLDRVPGMYRDELLEADRILGEIYA
jgi:hypothetical protein